jgi:HEAT repeat protein
VPPRRLSLVLLLAAVAVHADRTAAETSAADVAAVRRLLSDPSPSARAAALRRLAGSAEPAALALLVERLADPHPYVRRASAGTLGLVPDPAARARLARDAPRWKSETARLEACQAWSLWLDETGRRALFDALADPAPAVRAEAVRWLAEDRDPAVREALKKRLADPDPLVRAEALDALVLTPEPGAPLLGGLPVGPLLADPDPRVRLSALEAAAGRGGEDGTRAVLRALGDESWSVRLAAADLAGRVRDRRMLPALIQVLRDARVRVVDVAGKSLTALTGIPFDPEPETWTSWLETAGKDFDPATAPPPAEERPRPPPLPAGSRTVQGARFLDLPIRSRHLAFVLDCSHSMGELLANGRTRWAEVVVELERALRSMPDVTANLCVFADEVTPVFPRAVPIDAARREDVLRLARGRRPGGWTALYDAIAWGLSDPQVDTVVVLSDGAPTAGSHFTKTDFFAELRRANRWRRARIDVIAVGSDGVAHRWRDTLQRLAAETGGTCLAR